MIHYKPIVRNNAVSKGEPIMSKHVPWWLAGFLLGMIKIFPSMPNNGITEPLSLIFIAVIAFVAGNLLAFHLAKTGRLLEAINGLIKYSPSWGGAMIAYILGDALAILLWP